MASYTDKASLRDWAKEQRSLLTPEAIAMRSQHICEQVREAWQDQTDVVFLFAGFRGEPDLKMLSQWFRTAYPKVENHNQMTFFEVTDADQLVTGRYGIPEPDPSRHRQVSPSDHSLLLVPALALDHRGNRLGYGAGYYDRYLERFPQVATVGTVFDEFVVDYVPTEAHDRALDYVATDRRLFARKTKTSN